MDPIDVMMNEHQKILQVLGCLEKMVTLAGSKGRIDEGAARDMIRFFREYADRTHHAKEEDLYIPALDEKGLSEAITLSADLLREHVEGRRLVGVMDGEIPGAAAGEAAAMAKFSEAATAFVFMRRRHIRNEDNFLFPIGDLAFGADEQAEIEKKFEEFDRKEAANIAELLEIADRLADQFGVSKDRQKFGIG